MQKGSVVAYISCHNADLECALQLATDLRNRGIPLFLDRLDITINQDWITTSSHNLLNCGVLVVLLSPAYMRSPAGRNTLQRISELRRPIIPVMLHTLAATDYPTQVDYRQSIAMQGWQAEHIYKSGLNQLFSALENTHTLKIIKHIDPERRYINGLNRLIEAYKSHLEAPLTENELEKTALVMPAPRIEASWGLGATYINLGTQIECHDEISNLAYWASQQRRFALIGGNGVGKTTTLMRLMSEHVHEYLRDSRHTPVPLYIDLSHWNTDDSLADFMVQQAQPIIDPTSDIQKGRYVVYVDGLSELGIYSEVKLTKLRDWLHGKKTPQRVVIACDEGLYTPRYGLDLPIVMMLPLNENQRRAQISAYMGGASRAFVGRLELHAPARRWERNALLLRAAMFYLRTRPKGDLPTNSERLLIQVVELLCEGEQILNNPDWTEFHKILPRLASFAHRIMTIGRPYSVTPEQAVQFLGSEGLLHTLISARVLSVRMQRVRFWHRSLLNVFAGYHLKSLSIHEQLSYTEFDDFGRRVSHYWDAPLVALAGILDDANAMLLHISEVDPYLAVEALAGHDVREDVRHCVLERFMHYAVEHKTVGYSATLLLLNNLTLDQTVPLLLAMMRTGVWSQRVAAHEFLLRLPYPIANDLAELQTWNGEINDNLATYFAAIGEEAVPLLLRLLHSPNSGSRRGAAWALHIMKDTAAVVGLTEALSDELADVRMLAAQALREMPQAEAAPMLVRRLQDKEQRVRRAANAALLSLGASAVPALRRLLQSEDVYDKRLAIGVLGHLGDRSVIDDLLPYTEHENPDLRAISVVAAGQLKDPSAIAMLGRRAGDTATPRWSNQSVAQLAQQSLESIGTEEAMGVIQTLLLKRSVTAPKSNENAKTRLKDERRPQPTAQTLPPAEEMMPPATQLLLPHADDDELDKLLLDLQCSVWPERQRVAIRLNQYARRLHKRCHPGVVRRLEAGLHDDDVFIRETAVEALGHIADPVTTDSLVRRLSDPVWTIRMITMRALAEIGDSSVVLHIASLLEDSRDEVREVAAEVLGFFQRRETTPMLAKALGDQSEFVRAAIIRALGNIADERAVPALVTLLQVNDPGQQALILEALGKIGSDKAAAGIATLLNSSEQSPLSEGLTLANLAVNALETIGSPTALRLLSQKPRR